MEIKRKDIGLRIKQLRLENNLTQTEFAARIGAKQANLSYIENDGYKISLDIIMKIISKFDISYEWLLAGKGEMLKGEPCIMPIKEAVSNAELLDRIERLSAEKARLEDRVKQLLAEKKIKKPATYSMVAEPELTKKN